MSDREPLHLYTPASTRAYPHHAALMWIDMQTWISDGDCISEIGAWLHYLCIISGLLRFYRAQNSDIRQYYNDTHSTQLDTELKKKKKEDYKTFHPSE